MNIDYSQFYRGTTNIPSYGNGIYKKDTLVKYEFNTTDEHGSNLVKTTNALDMMRTMDGSAYTEYQKISKESSNEDRQLNALKYLTNWYGNAVKKNPSMIDDYEKQSEEYVEKNIKDQKLDATFSDIKTENKAAFLKSLKAFQNNNPNFLSSIINRELASKFWGI